MRVRQTALDTRAATGMPVNPDTNAILGRRGESEEGKREEEKMGGTKEETVRGVRSAEWTMPGGR